ncbi:hypothetical protein FPQ18DRAFT_392731 [Pyronema domesticum]|nr:hypothetical protein FPQ18DRAFT_392731 [Pyronema domesticum]
MDQPTSPNTVTDNNTSMTGVNSIRNNSSNTKPSENAPGNETINSITIEAIKAIPNEPNYAIDLWLSQGRKDDGVRVYRG